MIHPKEEEAIRGTLKVGEPHPAARYALQYLYSLGLGELNTWMESFASNAIEDNRLAEIMGSTLARILESKAVSDRYVLGLAWFIKEANDKKHE